MGQLSSKHFSLHTCLLTDVTCKRCFSCNESTQFPIISLSGRDYSRDRDRSPYKVNLSILIGYIGNQNRDVKVEEDFTFHRLTICRFCSNIFPLTSCIKYLSRSHLPAELSSTSCTSSLWFVSYISKIEDNCNSVHYMETEAPARHATTYPLSDQPLHHGTIYT